MIWNQAVYTIALKQLVRSRKMVFAGIVSVIPCIVALLAVIEEMSFEPNYYPIITGGLFFAGIAASIPLTCLLLAGGSIADDAEERTLSYLLVRPIPRATLYASRTLAVTTVAVGLAIVQVLTTWFMELILFLRAGVGETVWTPDGDVPAVQALWLGLGIAMLVAPIGAVAYTWMFSAISVIFTRYHFFASLVWFALWESLIGWVPVASAWVTVNHALHAIVAAMDPSFDFFTHSDGWFGLLGLPVVVLLAAFYGWLGITIMRRRDFHITSAAT